MRHCVPDAAVTVNCLPGPIGSLVKPAVYLTALAQPQRYTLTTPIDDSEVDLTLPNGKRWRPRNYDRQVRGPVPLHEALAQSLKDRKSVV